MPTFTALEVAAFHSIFSETPDLAQGLQRQLDAASVIERENSGAGFFTHIAVPDEVLRVNSSRVLGYETHARVAELEYGLGFVLFMKDGRLDMLEGYAFGSESTVTLDLATGNFEVYKAVVQRGN